MSQEFLDISLVGEKVESGSNQLSPDLQERFQESVS